MSGENPAQDLLKQQIAQNAARSTTYLRNEPDSKDVSDIAVIKGLSAERQLQLIEYRLLGYRYDFIAGKWVKYRKEVMNEIGIGNMMASLQGIADDIYFSNFDEKEIPRLAYHLYKTNLPHILIYCKDFSLDEKDFNVIDTILFGFIISAFKNAKNAGHRNVVRGTLSEQVFLRSLEGGANADKTKSGILAKLRSPFRRNK